MIERWNDAGESTPTNSTPWGSSWPQFVDDPRRSELLGYFEDRFGIGVSSFEGFTLWERPQAYWLLTSSAHIQKLERLRVHTTGIPVLRKLKRGLKPTTTVLQSFGAKAVKNIVNLGTQQLMHMLSQNAISLPLAMTPGYVILAYHHRILGCGLYTGTRLLSQIPSHHLPRADKPRL
jgi:NOL1/NOP2/fmu family ribosome biogenesis protein